MPEAPSWKFQPVIDSLVSKVPVSVTLRGRVFTGVDDNVIEDGFVIIEDGLIIDVGVFEEELHLQDNDGDNEIIETSGTILPGLINSHVHLAWDGIHDLSAQALYDAPEISAYKCASNMLVSLRSGITMVRDMGMNTSNIYAKQAIEQGILSGPRLIICGEAIVQTGGHTYWCCREATGADEMRRAVRDQVRSGADFIKIMACHDTLEFTDEELAAVVDESHRNNMPITAHATFDAAISRMADFEVDIIEHGGNMSADTIDRLVDRNIPIVTTFAPLVMQSKPEVARRFNIPEWKIKERQAAVADKGRYDSLVRASKAGVRIVFGTDAGSPAVGHDVIVPELEFMVSLGVVEDNTAALRSITSVAADVHGVSETVGTLVTGKEADIVVVAGNPIENLKVLANVKMTFVKGQRLI